MSSSNVSTKEKALPQTEGVVIVRKRCAIRSGDKCTIYAVGHEDAKSANFSRNLHGQTAEVVSFIREVYEDVDILVTSGPWKGKVVSIWGTSLIFEE